MEVLALQSASNCYCTTYSFTIVYGQLAIGQLMLPWWQTYFSTVALFFQTNHFILCTKWNIQISWTLSSPLVNFILSDQWGHMSKYFQNCLIIRPCPTPEFMSCEGMDVSDMEPSMYLLYIHILLPSSSKSFNLLLLVCLMVSNLHSALSVLWFILQPYLEDQ